MISIASPYHDTPGFKAGGTSAAAAFHFAAPADTLRQQVLALLKEQDMTTDECAARLKKSVLAIRPRFSELAAGGWIAKTKTRRPNASGHSATVWTAINHSGGLL